MQIKIVCGLSVIGILLMLCPGCTEIAKRPKMPLPKSIVVAPPVRAPEPPRAFWPEHPVTRQTDRSQSVRDRKTPSLISEFSRSFLTLGSPVFMRIFKESRELELWVASGETFVLFKTYPIAFFSGNLGPKLKEGDMQAPEGFYLVLPSAMNPASQFHLSFNIGYPNKYDREHRRTGSALMVHGSWVSRGCFAMTDEGIEEIYTIADYALNAGQLFFQVHIFPFRMTNHNMSGHAASPHIKFWQNLRKGYEVFENTRRPPDVDVKNQTYVFVSY